MLGNKLIPALWIRLIVIVAFGVWVTTQQMWFIVAFSAVVAVITGFQLVMAYRR